MLDINKIYFEDCLEGMKKIDDHSVDMIVCDLPYGTTQCSWDIVIPFEPLWKQYKRITKKNAAILLFGSQPFTSEMIMSNIKMFQEEIIWLKNRGGSGLQAKFRHIKLHENIILFSNGKYTFNPEKWIVDDDKFITKRKTFHEFEYIGNNIYGKGARKKRKPDDGSRNPISIISYQVPFTMNKKKKYDDPALDLRYHPTQKPLELIEYLIRTYSNAGDLVLDNCMGVATTAVACMNMNRNFIGFENDKGYYDIGNERIERNRKRMAEQVIWVQEAIPLSLNETEV